MSDLIERLRHPYPEIAGLAADEAADRIEALTADNERLREALKNILTIWSSRHVAEARAALETKP